jgi:hypothetical protein
MWKTIYDKTTTDGTSRHVKCEFFAEFPETQWNKNTESPIIKMEWHDHIVSKASIVCQQPTLQDVRKHCPRGKCNKCPVYIYGAYRRCVIEYMYFARMPKHSIYSGLKNGTGYDANKDRYEEHTLEYCQEMAVHHMIDKLDSVKSQLKNNIDG